MKTGRHQLTILPGVLFAALLFAACPVDVDDDDGPDPEPGNPVSRVETGPLNWPDLLSAIAAEGRYVDLDISACTMSGTEFDPGTANTGERYIVSLVLPEVAAGLKAGVPAFSRFRYFTVLKSLSGKNVETIGNYAFSDIFGSCTALTTVDFPAATSIGDSAFAGCTGLSAVDFPAATSIGDFAFSGCTGLSTVDFPAALNIGIRAFQNTALTTVNFPAATSIGTGWGSVFSGCIALTAVSLPAATSIGNDSFWGCTALTAVSLPAVTSIGPRAFHGCTALSTVSLSASLTNIEGNPFRGCTSLTAITVAANNPNYKAEGGKLLSKDGAALISWPAASGAVSLPGTTAVGDSAFSGCTLTTVSLPVATSIGAWAFSSCTALETVGLPVAATIGEYAFAWCAALETVSFPAAAATGAKAFYRCTALETASLPVATSIGDEVFSGCTALKTVNLPAAVTIGAEAFTLCTALKTVNLPAAAAIGRYAFQYTGATASLTVTLGGTPPALDGNMFYQVNDPKFVTVKVPGTASGYAASLPATYSGADTTDNWGNGFRGGGWNGSSMRSGTVNSNIRLTVETY